MADSRKPRRRTNVRPLEHRATRSSRDLKKKTAVERRARFAKRHEQSHASSVTVPQKPATHPVERKSGAERAQRGTLARRFIVLGIVVATLALLSFVLVLVLSYTPAFTITTVEAPETEHIASEQIIRLAGIKEGTTLLGLNEATTADNLHKNPWVGSVSFEREFPSTLKIDVQERMVDTVAVMSSGNIAWSISADNVWIEPVPLGIKDGQTVFDAALVKARELGALLVTDLPSGVNPVAGAAVGDEAISAITSYRQQFSQDFMAQVVAFSAPSLDGIMCTLSNGVEVALGAPNNIDSKEQVIKAILAEHEGKVTYVNVRTYSKPSYRLVESDNVGPGSGATASE